MTYRQYQWKQCVIARRRALIHKLLNYRNLCLVSANWLLKLTTNGSKFKNLLL